MDAPAPHGPLCVVAGEGMGKTYLLDALQSTAEDTGVLQVVRADCTELARLDDEGSSRDAIARIREQLNEKTLLLLNNLQGLQFREGLASSVGSFIDLVFEHGGRAVLTSDMWPESFNRLERWQTSCFLITTWTVPGLILPDLRLL